MGMHRVVVTSPLAIQPEVDHLQAVSTWNPGPSSLRGLTFHDVADPAIAGRQQVLCTQLLYPILGGKQLPLLRQLTRQLRGSVGMRCRLLQDTGRQITETRQQSGWQGSLENRSRKQVEDLHNPNAGMNGIVPLQQW